MVTSAAPLQKATGLWKLIPEFTASDYQRRATREE
jgi:hypothetical protein